MIIYNHYITYNDNKHIYKYNIKLIKYKNYKLYKIYILIYNIKYHS